ncbi:MAG TPA: penicillin acylase family protein, partial [Chitinophagales bacterium]
GIVNQNITYADKNDTIFLISNGANQARNTNYDWTTTVPGNTEKTLWTKFLPEDSMPQVLNPKSGYVFNANQTCLEMTAPEENPKRENLSKAILFDTLENNRSRRFYENISKYDKVSWDDFLKIKYDSKHPEHVVFIRNFKIDDLYDLKPENYPDISDAIRTIQQWNKKGEIADTNAAFTYELMYEMYDKSAGDMEAKFRTDVKAKTEMYIATLRKVKADFLKNWGKVNIPLGDYQRHIRGNVDLPIDGGPDMWNAKYGNPYGKGKRKTWLGESFILLAQFTKDGVKFRTVSPYGTSNKAGSKHYTDQMNLYVNHETKEESLSKDWAYKHAERIYKPGEE